MKSLKIGCISKSYPEVRTIVNKVSDVEYIYFNNNFNKILSKLENKLLKRNVFFKPFVFSKKKINNLDGYHFFNHIIKSDQNFITTFETFLPRISEFNNIHHYGNELKIDCDSKTILENLKLLAQDSCKKIISLSKCNFDMQVELLNEYPEIKDKILQKMVHIHPPQDLIIQSINQSIDQSSN